MKFKHPHYSIVRALKKIDVVVGLDSDYRYAISRKIVSTNTPHLDFSYYPIDHLVKGIREKGDESGGKLKILLGNSATASNNHIDILNALSNIDLDYQLVVPLNYGEKNYANLIIECGFKMVGEKFLPIKEFMSLENYNNLIGTCQVAIMNHYRQQAFGNILTLLWLGIKLFLNNQSPIFEVLKRKNVIVFDVMEISARSLMPLSRLEKEFNKAWVEKEYSSSRIIENLKKINYV